MKLYDNCRNYVAVFDTNTDNIVELPTITSAEVNINTLPDILSSKYENFCEYVTRPLKFVYYISDIHLEFRIVRKFPDGATNDQIYEYVQTIATNMFCGDFLRDIESNDDVCVVFLGDIAASFDLSSIFYSKFMEVWTSYAPYSCKKSLENKKQHIYSILGNHELWEFGSVDECVEKYLELFNSIGINFLHNRVSWFGPRLSPKRYYYDNIRSTYWEWEEVSEETSPKEYFNKSRFLNNIVIVGGIGFAGNNKIHNASSGLYREVISRQEEIDETKKWLSVYNEAVELARKYHVLLIVLTHNPIEDWMDNLNNLSPAVYFNGHTHHSFIEQTEENGTFVFANNQIGYKNTPIELKRVALYKKNNPFSNYKNGVHEITCNEYISFLDYVCEFVKGTGIIEQQLELYNAKFYLVKRMGYYGFFLQTNTGMCICEGGALRKIGKNKDIKHYDGLFVRMVRAYIKLMSPLRDFQVQLSEQVKAFGGTGKIHGCIIDIDYFNHIMVNPNDGKVTYYYSPSFGYIQSYSSLFSLISNHATYLLENYKRFHDNIALPIEANKDYAQFEYVSLRNSVYSLSARIKQAQRLFDKKVLRVWDEELILMVENNVLPN